MLNLEKTVSVFYYNVGMVVIAKESNIPAVSDKAFDAISRRVLARTPVVLSTVTLAHLSSSTTNGY